MTVLELISVALAAFAASDLDDLFLLAALFSDARQRGRDIVTGQFLGIGALIGAGALLGLAAGRLPTSAIRALGLIPLGLGLARLRGRREPAGSTEAGRPAGRLGVGSIAAITIANGGDNLGLYVPLFAQHPWPVIAGMMIVFLALTGVWCAFGLYLARHSPAAGLLQEAAGWLVPAVLIGLGLAILLGAFA
jgi:cadmium resistance protein CadD (predicted permease)